MTTTEPTTPEQEFAAAIAMCGHIASIFRKHSERYPERILAIRQMILATTPPDVIEHFYRTHLAPQE